MGKSRKDSNAKAERKFEKRLDFYNKVKDSVVLNATKSIAKKKKLRSRQKKLKPYDLSTLSEFLPELNAPKQRAPEKEFKLNCKSRRKLLEVEGKQLNTVLNHPAFQADPFGSIHQHVLSTLPPAEDKPRKKDNKNGKKKKSKSKKSKSSSGPASMEY
ncbi:unnamed protein product [Linum trigynum]|uniref:Ribosome biogenesis protein slx9-like n=1 Tax=Linum trigynum TaxID=586398 RepID=A0AAV2ESC2_9ROSI